MGLDIQALSVPSNEDLLPLSALLHREGVAHRIYEEGAEQVLMVGTSDDVEAVQSLYRRWRAGEFTITVQRRPQAASSSFLESALQRPVTLVLIALSIAGFALIALNAPVDIISLFTFTGFEIEEGRVRLLPVSGDWWRWITPAFLHFGWLHITFNSLL